MQLALDPLREAPKIWGDFSELAQKAGLHLVSGMFGCVGEDYTTPESIRRTGGTVLGREDHVRVAAEDFRFLVSEQPLGPDIPARHGTTRVNREDGKIGRALDDALEQLVLFGVVRLARPARSASAGS